jgi:hypothetical protein
MRLWAAALALFAGASILHANFHAGRRPRTSSTNRAAFVSPSHFRWTIFVPL